MRSASPYDLGTLKSRGKPVKERYKGESHYPFHPDGHGDPTTGAGDFTSFKNDILDLLAELWATGSVALARTVWPSLHYPGG